MTPSVCFCVDALFLVLYTSFALVCFRFFFGWTDGVLCCVDVFGVCVCVSVFYFLPGVRVFVCDADADANADGDCFVLFCSVLFESCLESCLGI